jgi:hypothetical protein
MPGLGDAGAAWRATGTPSLRGAEGRRALRPLPGYTDWLPRLAGSRREGEGERPGSGKGRERGEWGGGRERKRERERGRKRRE